MWRIHCICPRKPVWLLIASLPWACAEGVEVPSDWDAWGSESTEGEEDAGSEDDEDSDPIEGAREDDDAEALPPFDAAPSSTPGAGATSADDATSADTRVDASVTTDAGSSGTPIDAASVDARSAAATGALKVQWNTRSVEGTTQSIQGSLKLLNTGSTAVPLADVSVRYWLREAMFETLVLECYHWDDGRGVNKCVRGDSANGYTSLTARGVSAGSGLHYVELKFLAAAGELAPAGASPGAMQIAFHLPSYAPMAQTDDPSFDPLLTSSNMDMLFDAPKITAYIAGQLAWGDEPMP